MTPGRIATELLDRVASTELLVDQVENHFKVYLEKYKLDSNEILIEYCMHLMNSAGESSVYPCYKCSSQRVLEG